MKWFSFLPILAIVALAGCDQGARIAEQAKEREQEAAASQEPAAPVKASPVAQAPPVKTPPAAPQAPAVAPQPTPSEKKKDVKASPAAAPRRPFAAPKGVRTSPRRPKGDDQWATEADLQGIRAKAGPGMGKKGHGYGKDIFTYPVATYFRVRERIGLDLIEKNMQLYQATHGHYPRTQDEFRKEIIKANYITLPVLPEGHKFYYNPDRHELFVIKPERDG